MQPLPLLQPNELHWMPCVHDWLPVHTTSHAHELLHDTQERGLTGVFRK